MTDQPKAGTITKQEWIDPNEGDRRLRSFSIATNPAASNGRAPVITVRNSRRDVEEPTQRDVTIDGFGSMFRAYLDAEAFDTLLWHMLRVQAGDRRYISGVVESIRAARDLAIAAQAYVDAEWEVREGRSFVDPVPDLPRLLAAMRTARTTFAIERRSLLAHIVPEPPLKPETAKRPKVVPAAQPEPASTLHGGGFWQSNESGRTHVDYDAEKGWFFISLEPEMWESMTYLDRDGFEAFLLDAHGLLNRVKKGQPAEPPKPAGFRLGDALVKSGAITRVGNDVGDEGRSESFPQENLHVFADMTGNKLELKVFPRDGRGPRANFAIDGKRVGLGPKFTAQLTHILATAGGWRKIDAITAVAVGKLPDGSTTTYDPLEDNWIFQDWTGDQLVIDQFPGMIQFAIPSDTDENETTVQLRNKKQVRDLITALEEYLRKHGG